MPVTDVDKDVDALTMTITAEFEADAERLWELWSDPRQLERWWGPPSHPSTFVEHELTVGARTTQRKRLSERVEAGEAEPPVTRPPSHRPAGTTREWGQAVRECSQPGQFRALA